MAWSALLAATAAAAFATPAYADPALPDAVPDTGARPVPAGAFQLPQATTSPGTGVTPPVPPSATGPLAAAIYAKEVEVATLGDQLLQLRQTQAAARAELDAADLRLRAARDQLARAQQLAEAAAADALKDAAGLPPGAFGSDLHGLGAFSRLQRGTQTGADTDAAAREVTQARAAEQTAYESYVAAEARLRTADADFATLEGKYKQAEASLLKIKRDNAAQLAVIEREREALDQRLGAQFLGSSSVAGLAAHPRALAAVRYALAQLGDPYLWAAEGPDRFDCSGLMWAAYRSKGADYYDLPRVSRDQYYATRARSVSRTALLPGDLLFFASGTSWTTIHHVDMYIGNGKMVHAPTTGDVVKVSPVWWSRFYAATRVIGAVPAPVAPPVTPPPAVSPPPSTPPPATNPRPTTPPPTTEPPPTPTSPSPTPTSPSPTQPTDPTEPPPAEPTDSAEPTDPTADPADPTTDPADQQSSVEPSNAESGEPTATTTSTGG
jgi:peptidoglycan DL-endopeptidase CwlO